MLSDLVTSKIISTYLIVVSSLIWIHFQQFNFAMCQKQGPSQTFFDQSRFSNIHNVTTTRNAMTGCPKYKQVTRCFKDFFDEYTNFKRQNKREESGGGNLIKVGDSVDFYRSKNGSSKIDHQKWIEALDTVDDQVIPDDCHLFDRFDNCFRIIPCLEWYKSKLASNAYNQKYKTFVPKESMNALRLNWHSKCQTNHCPRNNENKCRQIMTLAELDKDNALLLELHALKLQVAAKVTEPKYGCRKINTTLTRVKIYRSITCNDNNESSSRGSRYKCLPCQP